MEIISSNTNMISLGNTGLRSGNPFEIQFNFLNAIIEWREQDTTKWDRSPGGGQERFLRYIQENNIWKNQIKLDNKIEPIKDIRLKTAFLSDVGLVTEERFPTDSGIKLRELMNSSQNTNQWQIDDGNYEWFKQMFKYDLRFNSRYKTFKICPIRSLIYCCLEFNNDLPYEFLKVFWSTTQTKEELERHIKNYKNNTNKDSKSDIFNSLILRRKGLPQLAIAKKNIKKYSANNKISENPSFKNFIKGRHLVGHGNGGSYLIQNGTYALLLDFLEYWDKKNIWNNYVKKDFIYNKIINKHKAIKSTKLSPQTYNEFLFKSPKLLKNSRDWNKYIQAFENTDIINSDNKQDLLLNFHTFYSVLTDIVNINEYEDMNFRHLKLAEIFYIDYDSVRLKLQFKYLFERVKDKLLIDHNLPKNKSEYRKFLETHHEDLSKIYDFLDIKYKDVFMDIKRDIPEVGDMGLIHYEEKEKLNRFEKLVNSKFNLNKVISLLKLIDNDDTDKIKAILKEDFNDEYTGSIPALFEYLLGIAFYWISDKKVKLEDVLAMGLDNNLLPRSHMKGGREDINGIKTNTSHFIIEATLSDSDAQRQMEAEPVPRHVARYIQNNDHQKTIAIFAARKLDPNNLVVLRNYKFSRWYDSDGQTVTQSMDILPLTIKDIIYILEMGITLEDLEATIDELISSGQKDGKVWYEEEVSKKFR